MTWQQRCARDISTMATPVIRQKAHWPIQNVSEGPLRGKEVVDGEVGKGMS